MYHDFILTQTINENGELKVHFVRKQYINWSYEERVASNKKTNTPLFPIIVDDDDSILISEKRVSKETHCFKGHNNIIKFYDEYSIPGGFLICITGPSGYIPSNVKLKENPSISSRHLNEKMNRFFELKMNFSTRQASVLLHVLERAHFGLSVDFELSPKDFKFVSRRDLSDPFDIAFSLIGENFGKIEYHQVKEILPDLKQDELSELTDTLNALIQYLKENDGEYDINREKIKQRISNCINSISLTSSVITVADAITGNGVLSRFIDVMINYFK